MSSSLDALAKACGGGAVRAHDPQAYILENTNQPRIFAWHGIMKILCYVMPLPHWRAHEQPKDGGPGDP
jgi:hypothetical protein